MPRLLAWSAHLYTSLGLVAAAGMAVLIVQGDQDSLRAALVLMLLATAIDASDGWLARRMQVERLTPSFDGRRLDDLIDFQTYTALPLLLIWRSQIMPAAWAWMLLIPLLASAYGFSQVEAKTEDNYFLGFPSYWNVVAFYLFYLQPPSWLALTLLLVLSVLTFVPLKYLYPSRSGPFSLVTTLLGLLWMVLLVLILLQEPADARGLTQLSLTYPLYYLLLSWAISLGLLGRRGQRS